MDINDALARIVAPLRTSIAENRLDATGIAEATCELVAIGFRYNADRFPPLPKEINWGAASPTVPQTLAEALLWKMGAWKKYQNFASHFADERSQSKGTDGVFFDFAKHVQTLYMTNLHYALFGQSIRV